MLKKSIVHWFASACVALCLTAIACDTSESSSNTNTSPAPNKAPTGASPTAAAHRDPSELPSTAPMKDVLAGRWVDDAADTFSWHFAADNFIVTSTNDKDLTRFPTEMQGKVASFYGDWKVTDTEIVLSNISGPGQKLITELRVPYRRISNQKVEIDGKTFSRSEIKPVETPAAGA
ncbi:MAG TPA: hypothetical protein P5081_23220 [Phycisphaerae bacterium]|nr:hypothetical protein [Phycisphaerae bacterium]HRW55794.1 hypothetical protein [Phycisphaerae bacterium]